MTNPDEDLVQVTNYEYTIKGEPDDLGHYIVPKNSKIPTEYWEAICSSRYFSWYKLTNANIYRKYLEI